MGGGGGGGGGLGAGVDLRASAGTHGHAQQSRAAPCGRLVATSECAAEPRRHPSLMESRFLPRLPPASAQDQSGKRPQCESAFVRLGVSGKSALVGNRQAARGPGYAAECLRAWEGHGDTGSRSNRH
jgi:hypothetical protein